MSAPGSNKVDFEVTEQGVAVVTLDHFPVNTLTNALQLGIEDASDRVLQDRKVRAVVVRGAGNRALCAGADIQDLNRKHERYPKKTFIEAFEELNVPVVALLQGFTLGGGLELALGCHYRVMADNGFVGLPEVNIGLLPGGQGTQRLPRVVGAEKAIEIMCSGQHVPAAAALKAGLVDEICKHSELLEKGVKVALEMAAKNPGNKGRRLSELPPPKADPALFKKMHAVMASKRRGETAPQLIIDCVEAACTKNFKEGLQVEAELFRKVLGGREANALQHIFFAERGAAKVPGLKSKPLPIKKVALIGTGLMAGGIAVTFAEKGYDVIMLDREQKFIDKGMSVIKKNYERSVKRGSKSQAFVDKALSKLKTTTTYNDLKDVDLAIEAVFEVMEVKKEVFAKLDKACKPACILASNTSFLSIDEIASATNRPEKVIGMHYFSPANVQPLLEVVRGAKSSPETIATAMAQGTKTGKWGVLAGNCPGFIANRVMSHYGAEAQRMLMEGADLFNIDKAATDYGLPLGPLQLRDLTGDVGYEARKKKGIVDPNKNINDWLAQEGRLGMKSGAGFYDYDENRKPSVNKNVTKKIAEIRKNLGIKQREIGQEEIFLRLVLPVVNESFKTLEEGYAMKPGDIDVALVHGYSWPRITGGPLHWADSYGLDKVLSSLDSFASKYPGKDHFDASKLLRDCVASNQTLAQFWSKNGAKYSRL